MSEKYDVGIVGVGLGANYGSVLTYFGLHETIRSFGKSILMVSKIDAKSDDAEMKESHATRFAREHYNVSKVYTQNTLHELNNMCKDFVVGSDQVWNYGISKNFGKAFYLNFVGEDKHKISYASSFGHQIDFAPEDERRKISQLMQRFNAISVREDSGVEICRDIYHVPAQQVIEPIYLLSNEKYENLAKKSDRDISEPYLLAYILDPTPEKKAAIQHVAKKKNLKVKVILDGFPWLFEGNKKKMDMDEAVQEDMEVSDFLNLYINSSYVITDSFHGTSFAIKFNKDFAAIGNKGRGMARFDSLFRLFGHRDRFTFDPKKIVSEDNRFLANIDFTSINNKINKEVAKSVEWLKEAFEKPVTKTVGTVNSTQPNPRKIEPEKAVKAAKEGIAIPDNTPTREQAILDVINNPKVNEWKSKLIEKIPELSIFVGRELKEYTNNKVGGPADLMVFPKTTEEIISITKFANQEKIPYVVLGNGTNILVRDGGVRGIVIITTELNDYFKLDGNIFIAGAGASLIEATYYLQDNSKSNFEWAAGVPGTIGGAVYMNAGTYTGDIRRVLKSVTIIDGEGNLLTLTNEEINWGLRYTSIQDHKDWIIIEAQFNVTDGNRNEMAKKMLATVQSRENNFPLEHPNHGSTFKWWRAPRLIKQAGLAGKTIGGVKISQKQPGFFINFNKGTASDYEALIDYTIAKVYEFSGFLLEPEVVIIGERLHKYQRYTSDSPEKM